MVASTVPAPAPTIVCPISLAAGQDGSASSRAPLLLRAASIAPSGQNGMPVRSPVSPGGITVEKRVSSCSFSSRVIRR